MNYPEFETAFEAQFQKHTDAYPYAAEYHRARFNQTIQYLLSSILEQTDSLIQQPETSWAHTEEIIGDILYCGEITIEQLFALEIPTQLTADRDFEAVIKERQTQTQVEHTRHRCFINFQVNVIAAVIAYTYLLKRHTLKLGELLEVYACFQFCCRN